MGKDPGAHRRDPQYKQAKRKGYRARSAFKLLEIARRFNIFKRAFYILDIGSVPGSWLQVAKEKATENLEKYKDSFYHRDHYKIMGVDVKKISPIEEIKMVRMDITNPQFQNEINSYFGDKLDLVISDASIKKSGIKFSDHINQIKLCTEILGIAKRNLKPKGIFIVKTFTGEDFNIFLKNMKKVFGIVVNFKPKATKKGSNETYVVGLKRR